MIDIDKAVIARLKVQGEIFEILVDCEKALEYKEGKGNIDDVLATNEVYKDVKKGSHASENEMKKLFNTGEGKQVAEIILKEGEIQLTAEYKKKLQEEKRKQIINIIHRNAIDPKTGLPHPPQRIENAFEEAKISIDHFKNAEEQIQDILNKIRVILPIKYEIREINVKIPAQYGGNSFHILKQYGKILNEKWENNGSLSVTLEVPAGMQSQLFDELNNLTHGSVESSIVRTK
ncbi:MAG: ribosome assembly factor SBDS [Actinomycetota bacterium]